MAKTQKNFYLNPELSELINDVSRKTGISFTKIVTAALIRYLIRDFPERDALSMELAMDLESGAKSLPEVFVKNLESRVRELDRKMAVATARESGAYEHRTETAELEFLSGPVRHWAETISEVLEGSENPLAEVIHVITKPK